MALQLMLEHTYADELSDLVTPWTGVDVPEPRIIAVNDEVSWELGIDPAHLRGPEGAAVLSGAAVPPGAHPVAQAYAGHQFGGYVPQLGDGRAVLLGEIVDRDGVRHDIHLKGSGPTPYARQGDGKAVVGPVLREYLMGEAMHALGIPTTRALAAVLTGETIMRDGPRPGAVLTRVAASHIRVGTFQLAAASADRERLARLADYTIRRHYPECATREDPYLCLLGEVGKRQAHLVARWMAVGFVHGVMNTDNMALSGETIDYGPCAMIDEYSRSAVFSSIDAGGRYAFGNQPGIAQWNLARFAETLLPLMAPDDPGSAVDDATAVITAFASEFAQRWTELMAHKIGLSAVRAGDAQLIADLLDLMETSRADYTTTFVALSGWREGDGEALVDHLGASDEARQWLSRWGARCEHEDLADNLMARSNPRVIARNHRVEEALSAAEDGDFQPFHDLVRVLRSPFELSEADRRYAAPPPPGSAPHVTFCGT